MRIKLFLLVDFLVSIIVTSYVYFTNEVDMAIKTGLALFIGFSPIGLILASTFVLRIARTNLEKEEIKINRLKALAILPEVDTVTVPLNKFLMDGDFFVTDLVPVGLSQPSLLGVAATAEQKSEHPLGRVIYKTAAGRGLKINNIAASKEFPGQGIEVIASGSTIRVGNPAWIESQGVSIGNNFLTKIDKLSVYGKTVLVLGIGRMARGIIALKDAINADAKEFLSLLKRKKLITVLLTATGKKTARSLAKNFSLDAIKTNLSPTDKMREVKILRAQGHIVAAISNDDKDLPAIKAADVSVYLHQTDFSTLISAEDDLNERAKKNLAELKAELERTPLIDEDENVATDTTTTTSTESTVAQVTREEVDMEIPTLKKFLSVREIALKAADLIKTNCKITYLSWIILVPAALMNTLAEPPIIFEPIMAICGVSICALLIMLNSLRMRNVD